MTLYVLLYLEGLAVQGCLVLLENQVFHQFLFFQEVQKDQVVQAIQFVLLFLQDLVGLSNLASPVLQASP